MAKAAEKTEKSVDKADKVDKATGKKIRSGDTVWWWLRGMTDNTPAAAVVTEVRSQNMLCLTVFTINGVRVYDGVRHREDPDLNIVQRERNGCWAERD